MVFHVTNSKFPAPSLSHSPSPLDCLLLVALSGPGNLSKDLSQPETLPGLAPAFQDTGFF